MLLPSELLGPQGPLYLDTLNPAQRQAVESLDGPLLVLAGAGTGKTRVLVTRLAHILVMRRAFPSQILAVTFTNKAAREMNERVGHLLGSAVEGLWLGTFHSLAARMLRRHAELVGLKSNFTILDTDDQIRLMKQVLSASGVDDKKWPARVVLATIERWKDRGLTPDRVPADAGGEIAGGRAIEIYAQYQQRLKTLNACDFGDLLLHCLTIFTTRPDVLEEWQNRFRYVLVDEYQDTNVAQYLWLRLLAQKHRNLCCVGDDDQCLPAGTAVTMADGACKPIEQIREGDLVRSAYGSGDFRPARVTARFERRRNTDLVRLVTAHGRTIDSTPEHVHFAGYQHGRSSQRHFTYLMHKRGVGYRLGVSQIYTRGQVDPVIGFALRCRHEHADALWVLSTHATPNEARAQEYVLSLTYGIPTIPFVARKKQSKNGLVHDPAWIKHVFASVDTTANAHRLLDDLGLDPGEPHHVPRVRNSNRRRVVVTLCGDRRGATPMHRISIVGNDPEDRRRLEEAGFSVRSAKANSASWRFETCNKDFGRIMGLTQDIERLFEADVIRQANILGRSLPFTRAASVMPGMMLATEDGTFDEVIRVERVPCNAAVYDLNIAGTHNFIANGIVTHNSIYSWRGAEVGNILRFERDFAGAKVVRLEQNYRSTRHILAAAAALIAHNKDRLGKTLWTEAAGGDKVVVRGLWDGEEEARWVGDEIEAHQRAGQHLGGIAVLVRAGFQTREFEERLITLGVPYRVVGGPRFYERQEIRDAIAYLRIVVQPADDLAFERIVNTPRRGIGDATLQAIHKLARAQNVPLSAAARMLVETDDLKPQARAAMRRFLDDLARWSAQLATQNHAELAQVILDESGYTGMWQADKSPEAPGRLENLKELIHALEEFQSLEGFLEHVSLVMENAEAAPGEMVNLMTLHSAKGLEFDVVFLPGWEEGLFPHMRALDQGGEQGLEEERRLAHVGLTRARRRAYVSFAANRRVHNLWQSSLPSRFVGELPQDHIETFSDQGLWGSASNMRPYGGVAGGGFGQGPGMARGRGPMLIEGKAEIIPPRHSPSQPFAAGARVFHQKFGYGRVIASEAGKLDIEFEHAGRKKVMDSFVQKA